MVGDGELHASAPHRHCAPRPTSLKGWWRRCLSTWRRASRLDFAPFSNFEMQMATVVRSSLSSPWCTWARLETSAPLDQGRGCSAGLWTILALRCADFLHCAGGAPRTFSLDHHSGLSGGLVAMVKHILPKSSMVVTR